MRKLFLHIPSVFFFFASAVLAAPLARPRTALDRIDFSSRVLDRHPRFLEMNTTFRINPVALIQDSVEIASQMQDPAPWAPDQISILEAEYFARQEGVNHKAITKFKEDLLPKLKDLPISRFNSLESDLETLVRTKTSPGGIAKWLALVPLIYGEDRVAIPRNTNALRKRIDELIQPENVGAFESLYRDLFPQHLAPIIANAANVNRKTMEEEIEKISSSELLEKATTPIAGQGKVHPGTLSLEEVPPGIALLRGIVGFDCSGLTVPHYVLINGVKTYFARQGSADSKDLHGYAIAIPVTVGVKTVPYVLTVNGSRLSKTDTQAIIHMIANDWGTTHVVLPNFEQNPYVVNTSRVKAGMTANRSTEITVDLPSDWALIDERVRGNYYKKDKIAAARLVQLSDLASPLAKTNAVRKRQLPSPYLDKEHVRIDQRPLRERALFASHAFLQEYTVEHTPGLTVDIINRKTNHSHIEENQRTLDVLGVSRAQVDALIKLQQSEEGKYSTSPRILPTVLGMGFTLPTLPVNQRARATILSSFYRHDPTQGDKSQWQLAFDAISADAMKDIDRALQNGDWPAFKEALKDGLRVPSEFNKVRDLLPKWQKDPRRIVRRMAAAARREAAPIGLTSLITAPIDVCNNLVDLLLLRLEGQATH